MSPSFEKRKKLVMADINKRLFILRFIWSKILEKIII